MALGLGGTEPQLPFFRLQGSFPQNHKCQTMQPCSDHVRTARHFFDPSDEDLSPRTNAKLYAVPGSRDCEPFLCLRPTSVPTKHRHHRRGGRCSHHRPPLRRSFRLRLRFPRASYLPSGEGGSRAERPQWVESGLSIRCLEQTRRSA